MEVSGLCILLFVFVSSVQCDCGDDKKRAALGFALRDSSPCRHGHWSSHSCRCVCDQGFTGHRCEYHINQCHVVDCNHGDCYLDHNDKAHCRCDTGYHGYHCTEFDPCRSVNCGTGTCMMTSAHVGFSQTSLPHCSCPYGYYGSHCENYDPCHNFLCNTGTCYTQFDLQYLNTLIAECRCPHNFYGTHCEHYDPCHNYDCGTGTCHLQANHVDAYCKCPVGYFGDQCEHFDACHNYNCGTGQCQGNGWVADCICPSGYFGDHCEIVPTTTTTKTTTSTTTTTTALPTTAQKQYTCKATLSITDLAYNVQSHNVSASNCTTGDNAGSDAFVLNHCDVEQPAAWKRGQNVMLICNSVPIYTPIATFKYHSFNPGFDTAAIFLGCLGDDIRIGLQTCDAGTRIEHFKKGGQGYRDATQYYVIQ